MFRAQIGAICGRSERYISNLSGFGMTDLDLAAATSAPTHVRRHLAPGASGEA